MVALISLRMYQTKSASLLADNTQNSWLPTTTATSHAYLTTELSLGHNPVIF